MCRFPDGMYPAVDARNNWWGKNSLSYVAGRIWERRDDDNLISVDYEPFITDNATVLSGKSLTILTIDATTFFLIIVFSLHLLHNIFNISLSAIVSSVSQCQRYV